MRRERGDARLPVPLVAAHGLEVTLGLELELLLGERRVGRQLGNVAGAAREKREGVSTRPALEEGERVEEEGRTGGRRSRSCT